MNHDDDIINAALSGALTGPPAPVPRMTPEEYLAGLAERRAKAVRAKEVEKLSHTALATLAQQGLTDQERAAAEAEQARRMAGGITKEGVEHLAKVGAGPVEAKKEIDFKRAGLFFAHLSGRKAEPRPECVTYEATARLLWAAFCDVVWDEQRLDIGLNARAAIEGTNLGKVMPALCWWLMAEKMPAEFMQKHSIARSLDPCKGIVLYGERGAGKSTLARAMWMVGRFFSAELGWRARRMEFSRMDEVAMQMNAETSLAPLDALTRDHRVIDEVKEEHFSVRQWGNHVRPIEMMLFPRHEAWKKSGQLTVITTNMPWDVLTSPDTYEDARLADRIADQYQGVRVTGPDRRDLRKAGPYRMQFTAPQGA
jgi:hypothetical protein